MTSFCSSCGSALEPGARFCAHCGAAQALVCGKCGTELPADARFCPSCGTSTSPAESAEAEPEEPATERKVISALFTDLVGFTADTEKADPEDVGARLATYHDAVRHEVERYEGRVEKLIGDGVFAVFGAPSAHEDDPERAVRVALRIQDELARLNEERPQLALSVRVAVTTGEALVRQGDDEQEGIVGDVVNTASRLEQVAPVGGVIVDERTHLATRNAIEYGELDPVSVKGKAEPIPVWSALGARSRYGVGVEVDTSSPFVGRHHEIKLLENTLDRVLTESSAQLVTVSGEPGVGKSRLVAEFQRVIDDRTDVVVFWRQGRCVPYGEGISFWALGEVIKAQAGILESESPDDTRRKLTAMVDDFIEDKRDRDWIRSRLAPLVGGDLAATAEREELFSAWLRFLEAMAARNPLIMVIEDLHWADDLMIEFIDFVVDRSVYSPILLVGTARPELFDDRPQWGGGQRNASSIALSPLSETETADLVDALAPDLLDELGAEALVARSGGNPLYATEFVRMLQDRGVLAMDEGAPLPDSIQALIAARIDLLDPDEKGLLQAAAVIGKVFWVGAVTFVTKKDARTVTNDLARLSKKELIRPSRRSSMKDQAEYGFWHGMVQDVAYGQLPREARLGSHVAVAQWLEATSGDRMGEVAELLAHHYGQAMELAFQTGQDDSALRAQTRRFLLMAAQRVRGFDLATALQYLERVLELDPDPPERATALHQAGVIQADRGDQAAGEERLLRSLDLARELGDRYLELEALIDLGKTVSFRGDADRTDELDREMYELALHLEPGPTTARALSASAAHWWLRGLHELALERSDEALAAAREHGPPEATVRALFAYGGSRLNLGDPGGLADLREALRTAQEANLSVSIATAYNNVATYLLMVEGPDEAVQMMEEAVEMAAQRGLGKSEGWSQLTLAESHYQTESWDRMRQLVADARTRFDDDTQTGVLLAWWIGLLGYFAGDLELAVRHGDRFLDGARRVQDAQLLVPALGFALRLAWHAHEVDDALEMATEFEKASEGTLNIRARFLYLVAEPLARLGELDLLERLVSFEPANLMAEHSIGLTSAFLAEAKGDIDQAARAFLAAADGFHGLFALLELVAALGAARNLTSSGPAEAAVEQLDRAQHIAEGLRAQLLLDEIAEVRATLVART